MISYLLSFLPLIVACLLMGLAFSHVLDMYRDFCSKRNDRAD